MSTDMNIRLAGVPIAPPVIRPAPEAAQQAVLTVLPADRSVTASDSTMQPNLSAQRQTFSEGRAISRDVVFDRAAGQIVYMSIDSKTRQVVNQYPEESRLRARAYLRAQDDAREDRKIADRTA
jgi:hypothetical protein